MDAIPMEVVCLIAGYTTPHTVLCLSRTCKRFSALRCDIAVMAACVSRTYPHLPIHFDKWNTLHKVARNYRDLFDLDSFWQLLANVPRICEVLMAVRDTEFPSEATCLHELMLRHIPAFVKEKLAPAGGGPEDAVALKPQGESSSRDEGSPPKARRVRFSVREARSRRKAVRKDAELDVFSGRPSAASCLLSREAQVREGDFDDEGIAAIAMLHRFFCYEQDTATELEELNKGLGLKEWGTCFLHFYLHKFTVYQGKSTVISLRLFLAWESIRSYNSFTDGITAEYLHLLLGGLQACLETNDSPTTDAILLALWNRCYVTMTLDLLPDDPNVPAMAELLCTYVVERMLPAVGSTLPRSLQKKINAVHFLCKACKIQNLYAERYFELFLRHASDHVPFKDIDFHIQLPYDERTTRLEEARFVYDWIKTDWDSIDWATCGGDYYVFVAVYVHEPESCGELLTTYFQRRTVVSDVVWSLTNLLQWRMRRRFEPTVYAAAREALFNKVKGHAKRSTYEAAVEGLTEPLQLDAAEVAYLLDDSEYLAKVNTKKGN